MNEILKLGLTLALIGFVASLALSLTYQSTEKRIETQQQLQLKGSLHKAMPEAEHFDEKPDYYDSYKENQFIGRVLKVNAQGYSSIIQILVGINLENKIIAADVLSQVETPGLGANVEKESFLSQFKGKDASTLELKKHGGNIDAITGATITSKAVVDEIRKVGEDCACDAVTAATKILEDSEVNKSSVINETEND